ncbi:MAG: 3,4-dihydroxy-2-butanone 4-phosphate synthase [Pseudomonadota bacterium]
MTNQLQRVEYAVGRGFISPVEDIVNDIRNGRMVILVDAEDRENEGDLVIAAQMATPDAVNFMAKHGRGLICLTLTAQRADQLNLDMMARQNRSGLGTAFTVSIEARDGISTGISAADRARTIATAIDPTKDHRDVVSPGHVFPLVARDDGVLVRAGHTEASVDLARMAGLYPAAVICEIMNDDGTMARLPDLMSFAQRHNLKIGTIEDMIAYRLTHDKVVRQTAERDVVSGYGGDFRLHLFETITTPGEHIALVKGDLSVPGPVLVRVHVIKALEDLIGIGLEPGSGSLIGKSMELIAKEGRGVVVLLRDLRPSSISEALGIAPAQDGARKRGQSKAPLAERKHIENGVGAQILRSLGVTDMVVLTNAPPTVYVGLEAYGLKIIGTRRVD